MKGKNAAQAQRRADESALARIALLEAALKSAKHELAQCRAVTCRDERHGDLVGELSEARELLAEWQASVIAQDTRLLEIESQFERIIDCLTRTEILTPNAIALLAELDRAWEGSNRKMRRLSRKSWNRISNMRQESYVDPMGHV